MIDHRICPQCSGWLLPTDFRDEEDGPVTGTAWKCMDCAYQLTERIVPQPEDETDDPLAEDMERYERAHTTYTLYTREGGVWVGRATAKTVAELPTREQTAGTECLIRGTSETLTGVPSQWEVRRWIVPTTQERLVASLRAYGVLRTVVCGLRSAVAIEGADDACRRVQEAAEKADAILTEAGL